MSKLASILTTLMTVFSFGQMKAQQVAPTTSDSVATVYFIKEITPSGTHLFGYAKQLGMGTQRYALITIE